MCHVTKLRVITRYFPNGLTKPPLGLQIVSSTHKANHSTVSCSRAFPEVHSSLKPLPFLLNISLNDTQGLKKCKVVTTQAKKACREIESTAPTFLNLDTTWWWVVCFKIQPLYPLGIPQFPLNRKLGGPQSWSERSGEAWVYSPAGISAPDRSSL